MNIFDNLPCKRFVSASLPTLSVHFQINSFNNFWKIRINCNKKGKINHSPAQSSPLCRSDFMDMKRSSKNQSLGKKHLSLRLDRNHEIKVKFYKTSFSIAASLGSLVSLHLSFGIQGTMYDCGMWLQMNQSYRTILAIMTSNQNINITKG